MPVDKDYLMRFAIVNIDGERDDNGFRRYWSNTYGWTTPEEADLYYLMELVIVRLPQGGAWVPID